MPANRYYYYIFLVKTSSFQILAFHSSFFNAMFYGKFDDKDKKEIVLNEIDREVGRHRVVGGGDVLEPAFRNPLNVTF